MDITVKTLKAELEALKKQQEQLIYSTNAITGAIQMTEYLIQKAETEVPAEAETLPKPEVGADSTIHTEADVDTSN